MAWLKKIKVVLVRQGKGSSGIFKAFCEQQDASGKWVRGSNLLKDQKRYRTVDGAKGWIAGVGLPGTEIEWSVEGEGDQDGWDAGSKEWGDRGEGKSLL